MLKLQDLYPINYALETAYHSNYGDYMQEKKFRPEML